MRWATPLGVASGMLAIVMTAGTATAQFDGLATPPDNYSLLNRGQDSVFLDANGDGFLDLAVARDDVNPGTLDSVQVFLNDGTGAFGAPTSYGVGVKPGGLVTADFNKDGRPDLATSNEGTGDVSVLLNNGAGFNPELVTSLANTPVALAVGEVNGDANLDLVTASAAGDSVTILQGNGNGTFAVGSTFGTTAGGGPTGQNPREIALADLNGNGLADAVVAAADHLVVMYNTGSAGFFSGDFALYIASGTNTQSVALGDLTNDGRPDLVSVSRTANVARVFRNNAVGDFPSFTQIASIATPTSPISVVMADLGNDPAAAVVQDRTQPLLPMAALAPDGDLDLVISSEGDDQVTVVLNDNGVLSLFDSYDTTGFSPERIAVGDIDNDGDIDVAVPMLSGGVDIFRNQSTLISGPDPIARIDAPNDFTAGGCETGIVPIFGVAYVPEPGAYLADSLWYRALADTNFIQLGAASSPFGEPGGLLYNWDTSALDEGYYLVQLRVRSESGESATDEQVIYISQEFDTLIATTTSIAGGVVCVNGTINDNNGSPIEYTVGYRPAGSGAAFTPVDPGNPVYSGPRINGRLASWDSTTVPDGDYEIYVEAVNGCGQFKEELLSVRVDNTPPESEILAPQNCENLIPGDMVPIIGTAFDEHIRSWTLQYTGGDTNGWTTIASGTDNVLADVLTEWDTTGLRPCSYTLRLLVSDDPIINCDNRRSREFLTSVEVRCPADLNGDGIVDNGDINVFVQLFLAGC